MQGKDFLSAADLTHDDVWELIHLAAAMKTRRKATGPNPDRTLLEGKTLAMLFQHPSLRTRTSFDVGMYGLGGHSVYLGPAEVQMGDRESVPDVARVLSRYVDGIMARVFKQSDLETLAKYATVPVINGLSDWEHPCQALADFLTIYEHFGKFRGLTLAFIGDGNNMANSLALMGAIMGMQVIVASPEGYQLSDKVIQMAEQRHAEDDRIVIPQRTQDPVEAVKQADVIYTDVWTSMGQEEENETRREVFKNYQLNAELLANAKPDAIVLHCLPAHRGEEITDDVVEGPRSCVFDQAENRLYAQQAVLATLLGKHPQRIIA